jgi:hypothetical protein
MKNTTYIQFAIGTLLVSSGCGFMLAHSLIAAACFGFAILFLAAFAKPSFKPSVLCLFGLLFLLLAAVISTKFTGSSVEVAARFFYHTVILMIAWLVMLWSLYRIYRRQKGVADA